MAFFSLFRKSDTSPAVASAIYLALVSQARNAGFYLKRGVPDTVDGRFDLIVLHTMLLLRRLRTEGKEAAAVSQALVDTLISDMDRSLREMGIGDMSIGKHVKKMAKAFYGRAATYEAGLDSGKDEALAEALNTNLYRARPADSAAVAGMIEYVLGADAALRHATVEDVYAGRVSWPTP